jgi:hypothetical protein
VSTEPASSNYIVAAPTVATPTAKSQEMVLVRRSELYALKRGIGRMLNDPSGAASAWAFSFLGVGVAATLSLLALVGPEGNNVRNWVVEAHGAVMFIGYFLAIFMGWTAKKQGGRRKKAHDEVCAEIDDLDQRAPTQVREETG